MKILKMFKQLSILILAALLSTVSLSAQKAKVKISPEMKLKKSQAFGDYLDSDDSGHYVYFLEYKGSVFSMKTTVAMAKYDNKFNEVWRKSYLADKKDIVSYGLKSAGNKFLWLLRDEVKRDAYTYQFLPIGKDGKQGKKVKLVTINAKERRDIPSIKWKMSKDTSKVAVAFINDRDKEKYDFQYFVKVLDRDLNELWSKKIKLRKSQEQVDVLSTVVGNDGAYYMLVKEYESRNAKESKKKKGKGKVAAYDIKIYRLAEGDETPKILEFDLGGKFARGASLSVSDSGEITAIGMFSNLKRGNINGVYYLKMTQDGKPITSNMKAFSSKELGYLSDRNRDKDKQGNEGIDGFFRFGEQLIFEDGSVVITAEENYTRTTTDSRGRTRTTFHSRDIVVISMDADGKIKELRVIPKRQAGSTNMFNSHVAMAVDGQGAYFFYNDDEDNMKRTLAQKAKRISSFRDCVTASTSFGLDGKMKRKALLESKEMKALLLPGACKKIGSNEMFFVAMKPKLLGKSNFRMGTITIE